MRQLLQCVQEGCRNGHAIYLSVGWRRVGPSRLFLSPPARSSSPVPIHPQNAQLPPPPTAAAEYLEVMKDKGLVLRTDAFEVVLAQLDHEQAAMEAGGGGGGGGGDDNGNAALPGGVQL